MALTQISVFYYATLKYSDWHHVIMTGTGLAWGLNHKTVLPLSLLACPALVTDEALVRLVRICDFLLL